MPVNANAQALDTKSQNQLHSLDVFDAQFRSATFLQLVVLPEHLVRSKTGSVLMHHDKVHGNMINEL